MKKIVILLLSLFVMVTSLGCQSNKDVAPAEDNDSPSSEIAKKGIPRYITESGLNQLVYEDSAGDKFAVTSDEPHLLNRVTHNYWNGEKTTYSFSVAIAERSAILSLGKDIKKFDAMARHTEDTVDNYILQDIEGLPDGLTVWSSNNESSLILHVNTSKNDSSYTLTTQASILPEEMKSLAETLTVKEIKNEQEEDDIKAGELPKRTEIESIYKIDYKDSDNQEFAFSSSKVYDDFDKIIDETGETISLNHFIDNRLAFEMQLLVGKNNKKYDDLAKDTSETLPEDYHLVKDEKLTQGLPDDVNIWSFNGGEKIAIYVKKSKNCASYTLEGPANEEKMNAEELKKIIEAITVKAKK